MRLSTIIGVFAACCSAANAYDALTFNACPPIRAKQKCDPIDVTKCEDEVDAEGRVVLDETKPDLSCKYYKLPPTCKQTEGNDDCIKHPPNSAKPCGQDQTCLVGGSVCSNTLTDCDVGGECIEGRCRYMQLFLGVHHKDITVEKYLALTSAQKSDWDFLFMQEMSFAAAATPSTLYVRDQFDHPDGGMVQIIATQPYVTRKDWANIGYNAMFFNNALKDETSRLRTTFPGINPEYPPCYQKLTDPKVPFKGANKDIPNLIWTEQPCPSNKFIDPTLA